MHTEKQIKWISEDMTEFSIGFLIQNIRSVSATGRLNRLTATWWRENGAGELWREEKLVLKQMKAEQLKRGRCFEAFSFSALWLKQQSTVILSEGHPYIHLTINTRLTDRLQLLLRRTCLSNAHIPCYVHKNMIKKKTFILGGHGKFTFNISIIAWCKWCKFIPSRIMGSNKYLPDFWIHFCSLSSIWQDMKCAECPLSGNIAFGRIIKQSHYFIHFHCAVGKEMLCVTLSWQQNVFTMLIIGEPGASCHNLYFSQGLRFLMSSYTNVCFPRCYAC